MATEIERVIRFVERLRDLHTGQEPSPKLPAEDTVSPRISRGYRIDTDAVEKRWQLLNASAETRAQLLDPLTISQMSAYEKNIENFIGAMRVPIGIAGPLRVRGLYASGDYYVPLATTEAALVASCTRGCQTISDAGGCTSAVILEGVSRAPVFAFKDVVEAGRFVLWLTGQVDVLKQVAGTTTRHGRLDNIRIEVDGNHVYLLLDYLTGDAAGQNMVTFASQAVCEHIIQNSPVAPMVWYIEGNMSGDKKATFQSFQSVRGKKVVSEVLLPAEVLQKRLHCTSQQMMDYILISGAGGVLSGGIGVQGHYANSLAAMYIACGQDAACVAESAVGMTRFEMRDQGALYAVVTLPNIIVGTVGGGTGLPSQKACLDLLGMSGAGHANAFAELCGAMVLAGELSIIAALASGQFAQAHQRLARKKDK